MGVGRIARVRGNSARRGYANRGHQPCRSPYAGYEKILGRVFFSVDPANPRNSVIVDIDKVPRSANGRVEFSADFYAVRPKTGGNGVAIVDVVNRGSRVTRMFNRVAGGSDPDVGDGFLLRRGFTIIAVGWEFDLPASGDLLRIRVPAATECPASSAR